MNGEFFMTDRLPSNPQSHLPNYGQGQPDDKNKDVDKKKDGATGQSGKNAGQGHADKNKAAPQMKSKEGKKEKAPSESGSDDAGVGYGDNFDKILFGDKQGRSGTNNIVEKKVIGAKPSPVAQKLENDGDSSSKDDAGQSGSNTLTSPRQQQPDKKEKTANNKAPKAFLKNFGKAIASIASDPPVMALSPRKTKGETPRNTHRNTQDSNSGISNTAKSGGMTTTNTTATSREKVTFTDILKKIPDQPVSPPQDLARITISAESNEGKIHLTKTTAKTMFRSSTSTYQGKPLGANYRTPFLRSCFLKANFVNIIEEMQQNYTATKKTGNLESESLRKKAESVWNASENNLDSVFNHKSVMAEFSGLTKPLADKINGSGSKISTSLLPQRFLHFLIEFDHEIVRWHQQTPDGPEKLSDDELRNVRRTALSNYLSIYGPYTTIMLAAQEVKSEKKIYDKENPYVLLENILGKKTWEQYDEFLSSAMDCDEEQYLKIKDKSNEDQERIAKEIEARKTTSMLQTNSHLTQSNLPGSKHSNTSTVTTTTTNTFATTTTTNVSNPATTSTKESERVASDAVNKPKPDPRRSPAKLAATAVNAVKESKKNINKENNKIVSAPTKPSLSSMQQVFRDNVTVDGHEIFKEFIVPYMVLNLKQTNVVSLGEKMYAAFLDILEDYNSLKKQALDENKKNENLVNSAAEKRSKGFTDEADAMVVDAKNFSARAKAIEDQAQILVNSIVKPVLDYFSPKNLVNILPEQLLDFLALCDKELLDWMRAESVGMTDIEMRDIRIRGLTGLLMNRGVGVLFFDEFSTSKNPALSEQENSTISAELQRKTIPVQQALNRGFNSAAKTDMNEFLSVLEKRTEKAIARSKDMEKDYKVARMQAGDDGQVPVSPRKRVKNSQISKDKSSSASALTGSVNTFLRGHGLISNTRLFNNFAEFLVSEFDEREITDPSDAQLAEAIKLYIDLLRSTRTIPPKRIADVEALENSIRPLLPKAEDADQTQKNPVTTQPAKPSAAVTTTTSVGEINEGLVSAYFDIYDLKEIDPDSYRMILQRVNDEFTANSSPATFDDVTKIGLLILESNMVKLSQAGDLRAQKLEAIIAELKQFS
jgi:hypothetical protein